MTRLLIHSPRHDRVSSVPVIPHAHLSLGEPLDLVEVYRAGLIDPPSALRLALREFVADCRAKPETAAACALIGLLAGLAVTFGLAELLIRAGAVG